MLLCTFICTTGSMQTWMIVLMKPSDFNHISSFSLFVTEFLMLLMTWTELFLVIFYQNGNAIVWQIEQRKRTSLTRHREKWQSSAVIMFSPGCYPFLFTITWERWENVRQMLQSSSQWTILRQEVIIYTHAHTHIYIVFLKLQTSPNLLYL